MDASLTSPPPPAAFSTKHLRTALGQFATGVAIVTARGEDGRPMGLTINSFASVSLEPPLVLWSLDNRSSNLAAFNAASHHAIHILSAAQRPLAELFATRGVDRFADLAWQPGQGGVPLLLDCAARFECRQHTRHPTGDHLLYVLEVLHCHSHKEAHPLIFHGGRFGP
jgi:flavin reductase (DIM6/NTAB) family NADH-FMN oxidoreductase RutF